VVESREIQEGEVLLELEDIHMYFRRVGALAGVSLDVKKGEIHSIIGPNGAGKTVMMNCIRYQQTQASRTGQTGNCQDFSEGGGLWWDDGSG
jgi:ABC-type branched-subunit amino acid transport system ATPase component